MRVNQRFDRGPSGRKCPEMAENSLVMAFCTAFGLRDRELYISASVFICMGKRGVSTIIASVLTVLIVVAAVSMLSAIIFPLISKAVFIEDPNLRFTIDTESSYTVYDSENGFLNIRIKRGADTSEVVALKFIIDVEGSSMVRRVSGEEVVSQNAARVYQFAIGFYDKINSVKVAPIFLYKGEEIEGQAFILKQRIPVKPNALDDQIGDVEIDGIEFSEGLVFYYSFDEPSETGEIIDLSGYGHTGTLLGEASIASDPERGMVAQLDGDGDYLNLEEKASLATSTSGSKTFAFWAKPECKGAFEDSMVFGSYLNYYIDFYDTCGMIEAISFCYEDGGGSTPCFTWGNAVYEDEWHYYALRIKVDLPSVEAKLYIDGEEFTSQPSQHIGGYGAVNEDFYFGTDSDGAAPINGDSFKGHIDEFRIYNTALTLEEISDLHEASLDQSQ